MTRSLLWQKVFFFGMVAILVILALILVWPFGKTILIALAVVVIMKPLHKSLMKRKWIRGSESRATGVTILIFILLIAIPTILIIGGAISQANTLIREIKLAGIDFTLPSIVSGIEQTILAATGKEIVIDELALAVDIEEVLSGLTVWLGELLANLGQSIPGFFTNAVIFLVLMYVLLPRYQRPGREDILDIVPLPLEITHLFLDKADMMITAIFKGTFVIAIVQGLAMGLVLWIAGVPYVSLLTIISMFLSLIPMFGISLVAWPLGILLILGGNVWQGIFVIGAFLLVVANIDTVLRPFLVPKGAYLNPALLMLSVLGGLSMMGFIGLIYGPVIMILLSTSIEVYSKYMMRSDLETLEKDGHIDLKELGLEIEDEDQEERSVSQMLVTSVKNFSAKLRGESDSGDNDQRRLEEPNTSVR
jgi:predicted PurR-regulated permease PerM